MMKKIVLVTGGNRGIGKEICRQLGAEGHTVILTARDLVSAEAAADEIPGNIRGYKLDIRSDNSAKKLINKLQKEFGHIDVLINNAAIWSRAKMKALDIDELRDVMETNFYGAIRTSKTLLPLLKASSSPSIINISSEMGQIEALYNGGTAAYRLSKSSLNAFTILLATELKEENIRVNAVDPGWTKTEMGGLTAPRSIAEGADTIIWLATEKNSSTGKFFRDRKETNW